MRRSPSIPEPAFARGERHPTPIHEVPAAASRQAPIHQSIERLNGESERHAEVVGIFPNEDAITRLVGALLLEQNEWPLQGARNIMLESIVPVSDGLPIAAG